MRYRVLACDYDGTIAHDGVVHPDTLAAFERLVASGRRLVLVTGRELPDLLAVFPGISLFSWVVVENGGLLYCPATREEFLLAPEASTLLARLLQERGVARVSVGRTIVATWEPYENLVLGAIRDLGLELQVIFNKGAVMVLPTGVNKRTGLTAALERLGLSPHECVGVGDAENDHAFLSLCECAVAVRNALPALKGSADWVTRGSHGQGVQELIERLLSDDLESLEPKLTRHHLVLGAFDDGGELGILPYGPVVLVAGGSGAGKTTATMNLIERLTEHDYQVCIVDPEGDHEGLTSAVVAGTQELPPEIEQVRRILARPANDVVVNLLAVPLADRPRFFITLLTRLYEQRAANGRPHWIIVDEAHHVMDGAFRPTLMALPSELRSMVLVTVLPERLPKSVLEEVDLFLGVGEQATEALRAFAEAAGRELPRVLSRPEAPGEALAWQVGNPNARRVTLVPNKNMSRRHRRKYAHGELAPDKSFYFRGRENKLNLRAHNLVLFNEMAAGVDDDTWLFHLQRGEYSEWMRDAIKDDALAEQIAQIEGDRSLSPEQSRERIRELIEAQYTAPA